MNPFKPTAGKMPPVLIGRQSTIDDFSEALENGVGAPGRIMLVTGQRGFGKTVMLTEFRRIAKARHWETIGETASEGLVARLVRALAPHPIR
ncbi:ATPase AAA [Bifidobacterium stellenboschense]|uniref:ATPase AAA n=1 Tax=Bifidobacterium stellenboschense TaxID=762211 RepID=A0A087DWX2_9BIFI|nr:ATPase AAA [Bifidobacterium stellenboschense]